MKSKQQTSRVNWGEYSRDYNRLVSLKAYQQLCNQLLFNMRLGDCTTVLDLGCGTGYITSQLVAPDGKRTVHALDGQPEMLDLAKARCRGKEVTFKQHDLLEPLPFENNTFDAVLASNVLYALHEPELVLKEIFRCLKSSGRLVLTTPRENFQLGEILRYQLPSSSMPASFWKDLHQNQEGLQQCLHHVFTDGTLLESMKRIAAMNVGIINNPNCHMLSKEHLLQIMHSVQWSSIDIQQTYADQNWLVTAVK